MAVRVLFYTVSTNHLFLQPRNVSAYFDLKAVF